MIPFGQARLGSIAATILVGMRMKLFAALLAVCWLVSSLAAEEALPPPTSVPESPEAMAVVPSKPAESDVESSPVDAGDVELRVYRRDDGTLVEEHALHGIVYMIKIQPPGNLPAYYLYDSDGDGSFERRLPGDYKHIAPPMWVIKRF